MTFAMCLDPEALIFCALFLLLAAAIGLACVVAVAFYATVGLAKLAAARHNRLASNER